MKINKKYLAGSAAALILSVCSYELGLYQARTVKENNRVSYVDGKQSAQKTEDLTPDEVSKKEGINAEQIVIKITDQGYVTSHGDHYHYYNGKVPYDAIISEELLMKDPNYQLKDEDIVMKEGLQQTMVQYPWHVHRDATPQMMVTSLMHPISLKILVMLISFLMATITIIFLRVSYQPANWLLQKPFYLVEVANQIRLLIAVPITTLLAAM